MSDIIGEQRWKEERTNKEIAIWLEGKEYGEDKGYQQGINDSVKEIQRVLSELCIISNDVDYDFDNDNFCLVLSLFTNVFKSRLNTEEILNAANEYKQPIM